MDEQGKIHEGQIAKDVARREETDPAFAEVMENERKQRLKKSIRLRKKRLVQGREPGTSVDKVGCTAKVLAELED